MGNTLAVLIQTALRWSSRGFCRLAVAQTSWYHMQTQVLWRFSWTQAHFIVSSAVLEKKYWPGVYKRLWTPKLHSNAPQTPPVSMNSRVSSDALLNSHSFWATYIWLLNTCNIFNTLFIQYQLHSANCYFQFWLIWQLFSSGKWVKKPPPKITLRIQNQGRRNRLWLINWLINQQDLHPVPLMSRDKSHGQWMFSNPSLLTCFSSWPRVCWLQN